jgi:hypothetical protein
MYFRCGKKLLILYIPDVSVCPASDVRYQLPEPPLWTAAANDDGQELLHS